MSVPSEAALHDLVDRLYAATLEPARWPDVLQEIARVFDAVAADLYLLHRGELLLACIGGVPADTMGTYLERFHGRTRRYRAVERLQEGRSITDLQFISHEEMARTPFYEEFLRPLGTYHSLSAAVLKRGNDLGLLGIQLDVGRGPPDRHQLRLMKGLSPHVRRAAQVQLRLADAETRERALGDSLDRLAVGIVLLDRGGKVVFANRLAERVAAEGRGLSIERRRLRASDRAVADKLERAVATATRADADLGRRGGSVLIRGHEGRMPLSVLIAPLSRERKREEELAAIICITDPERPRKSSLAADLQALHDLTPAESLVAAGVAKGSDVRTIAAQHRISYETARTHVKRVFDKTGVRNQAGLAAIVATGAGGLKADHGKD